MAQNLKKCTFSNSYGPSRKVYDTIQNPTSQEHFGHSCTFKEACTILGIDNNPEEGIHILREIGYSAYQARIILGID